MSGGNQEGYWRPSLPHDSGKPQTVHRSRHLDVCEQYRYSGNEFQEKDRVIGVDRLYNFEAQFADQISRIHADEGVVLNYQDKICGFVGFGHLYSG